MTSSIRVSRRAFSAAVITACALVAGTAFAPSEAAAAPRHVVAKGVAAKAVVVRPNVVVRVAPPVRRVVTVRPARPSAFAVWTDGYWRWNGARHVWVAGHWRH
ncbi:YXWGXW repeat-containing protein [Pyruvatibacter sp.]|uniref:YXWGXW repeat-containing protein n=1 Tax=Pyruvatibacter sp. TaxID=1981328 RepID=UPI0032EE9D8C